ncbi:MAG TPA: hypothetical protein VHE08_08195, partial [Solirubrobacterales bacterium]|nr:hypothetical protein [Solirubrobacterales bacterium]
AAPARRRRLLIPIGALAIVVLVVVIATSGGGNGGGTQVSGPRFVETLVVSNGPKPLPAPISGESVVGMSGGPLIIGRLDSSESSVSGVFQLDPASGRLREARALTGPLHDAAAVELGSQVLAFGGDTETIPSVLATTNGSKFTEVTELPTPGRYLTVAALGGRIYAFGGEGGSGAANDAIQEVDPKAGTARWLGAGPHRAHARVPG